MPFRRIGLPTIWVATALLGATSAPAQPLSLQDSFRIGSGASVLCSAQSMTADPALIDLFDRGYSLVCRDAAVTVGKFYALRSRSDDPLARLAQLRAAHAACMADGEVDIEGVGPAEALSCRLNDADVAYRVYALRRGGGVFVAEGLGGYDSALRLGLRSLIADRVVEGEVSIATTGAGDPAAFARAQAASLDPQRARAEAYRRNNAGSYAQSAEFFAALGAREDDAIGRAEAIANEALQKSNLGRYAEAEALFSRVRDISGADPVTSRRLRNYFAMHLLNQGATESALAELDRPVPESVARGSMRELVIDRSTAARLSAESAGGSRIGEAEGLTEGDKIQILDGQALQLRGTAMRLQGRNAEAVAPLTEAIGRLYAVRQGRIAATVWMRAQIHGELAEIAELRGDRAEAVRQHRSALDLLETHYPGSSALLSAKGRFAAHYVRTGEIEPALALFRDIVRTNVETGDASPTLARMLAPYFELLVGGGDQPGAAAELFMASQMLVRPGVAQTQAVLARELSGGSGEAARLFRQAVSLTRDIEASRTELARLEALEDPSTDQSARIAALQASLAEVQLDQIAIQARLADFPRYRVVSNGAIEIVELQQLLRDGEAYYKMTMVGDAAYAVFATPETIRAFRIGIGPAAIEREVDAIRATIALVEDGQLLTFPFDLERAHTLYEHLFGPIGAEIAAVRHLIFEPDGAMLRLPPNLLVTERSGVDRYRRRGSDPTHDGFDFRGVAWLGRERDISTAVSPRAFRDVRNAPRSQARAEYIGFGQNAPVQTAFLPGAAPVGAAGMSAGGCAWPLAAWNRPISANELFVARRAIAGDRSATEIVTGEAFTDVAIGRREDLSEYRILHFATHGLVQAPRPECPVQPALLTSFGGEESDGLLTFAEIFDLRLDADIVILSACDTAGQAGRRATEEAGLATGGDFELDGLVRAFVGAGSRMVVASHWPVPDDFDATARLISGLFEAPASVGTAGALRRAQQALMDDPATSHPYYWSGFAVVGDGAAPVIRTAADASSGSMPTFGNWSAQ